MEIYKYNIKVLKDKELSIVLPKSMQAHEYFEEIVETSVAFGQHCINAAVSFHNKEYLIISDRLAAKLLFPFNNVEMHVKVTKSSVAIGPLVAVYVKENEQGQFGLLDTLLKDLARISHQLGVALGVFSPNNTDFHKETINGYIYNENTSEWVNRLLPLPNVIFDRGIYGSSTEWAIAHEERKRFQQYSNILKYNSSIGDKYEIHTILNKNPMVSPYLPDTVKFQTFNDFMNMIEKHPSLYIKPINGTQGQNIYKIKKQKNIIKIFSNNTQSTSKRMNQAKNYIVKYFIKNKRKFLVQQEINLVKSNNRIIDFRALLQKKPNLRWGVTAIIARIGKEHDITSNLASGGTVKDGELIINKISKITGKKPGFLLQQIKDISILVAYTLENHYGTYGELGIDIGIDKSGKPWIIEINPRPGRKALKLIDKNLRLKSLRIPIEYCLQLWLKHCEGGLK
ncbi:YheC/YheD family protein [Desulfuribacillus alkaliarsenatis]|uniref:ATP-grasp domain-containing protein n=1 Tax=Desulfuribacillus alkaliarsenatis TaxID=766136 RepID=A0A1E5FZT8_9FIRM|nr:YheC/YheD family protein [Desulfuribacillus alkaliarsenatis]OEF96013.1 hypothetical protein BHF68_09710 [Desulfuribacillus alkaliarsenatis]